MKQIKKLSERYFGVEAIIAALLYTIMLGTIEVGGLLIKTTYLIAVYVVLKFIYRLEGRISIAIALGFLGFAAIFLMANDGAKAYWAAEIAFIFLVIGVLWQITEVAAERREQANILKANNGFVVSFWSDKQLVVSIIFIIFMFIYSYKVNSRFLAFQENIAKMQQKNIELKTNLLQMKKKTAIKVFSGNRKLVEAGRIVDLLRKKKIGTVEISNTTKSGNTKAVVQYKDGNKNVANRIGKWIAGDYSVKVTEKLADESPFDVIVILGKVKKD
jgi:hypothetical protein